MKVRATFTEMMIARRPHPVSRRPRLLARLLARLVAWTLPCLALLVRAAPADPAVELTWAARVPMRDGVHLSATVYHPAAPDGPVPVIACLTPYVADTYHEAACYFAEHGYAFALVDVRGRGNSGGAFVPFEGDGRDGYDLVEWLAAQPWCNGRVGLWGGSYDGFTQWATAAEFPPHLEAIAPASPVYPGLTFPNYKNIGNPAIVSWLALTSGATDNWRLYNDMAFWARQLRRYHVQRVPFRRLDTLLGFPSAIFQTWVDHAALDRYWADLAPSSDEFTRLDLPILSITGYYDEGQLSPLTYYRQHAEHAPPAAVADHVLLIGPWDHAGTASPALDLGGLTFRDESQLDLDAVHLGFYDWALRDGERPDYLSRRLAYYVVGTGEWKHADALAQTHDRSLLLHLDSEGGRARDVFRSGVLTPSPPRLSAADAFVSDPLDTTGLEPESEIFDESWLTNQWRALSLDGNGVVYHSQAFEEPVEVAGITRLVAWISMDVPDADLGAYLYEVTASGRSVLLARDVMRARYRQSLWRPVAVEPGQRERYVFEFPFFARELARGSRLRLLVTGLNSLWWERNYNAGGTVADEGAAQARTAHVTLHHDARSASYLEVPVASRRPAASP